MNEKREGLRFDIKEQAMAVADEIYTQKKAQCSYIYYTNSVDCFQAQKIQPIFKTLDTVRNISYNNKSDAINHKFERKLIQF